MDKLYRYSSVVCSLVCIVFALIYFFSRFGYKVDTTALVAAIGITLFLLNITDVLWRVFKYKANYQYSLVQFSVFILLCLFGFISTFFEFYFIFHFAVLGYCAFLYNLFQLFINRKVNLIKDSIVTLLLLYFSISVASIAWNHNSNPLLFEGIAALPEHFLFAPDSLLHTSIIQMIDTFEVASTGLHGVPYINYHFGSHVLFLQIIELLKIHPLYFYQMVYTIMCIPFFFKSFLILVLEIQKYLNIENSKFDFRFLFIFIVGFIGYERYSWGDWDSVAGKDIVSLLYLYCSESYNLSLSFLFLFIGWLLNFYSNYENKKTEYISIYFLIPIWIGLIGIVKISTIALILSALFYFHFRLKLYKKLYFNISLLSSLIIFILLCILTIDNKTAEGQLYPFFFFKEVLNVPIFIFIPSYFFWLILFIFNVSIIYRIFSLKRILILVKQKKLISVEFLIVVAVVGFVPGMIMSFEYFNFTYFSEIQKWLALAFFLAYLPLFNFTLKAPFTSILKFSRYFLYIFMCILIISLVYLDLYIYNKFYTTFFLLYGSIVYLTFYNSITLLLNKVWAGLMLIFILISMLNQIHSGWDLNFTWAFCRNYNIRAALANYNRVNKIKYIGGFDDLKYGNYSTSIQNILHHISTLYYSKEYESNANYIFLNRIVELNNLPKITKSHSIIFIKDYDLFVKKFKCTQSPFIVPALTGMPLLYGVPSNNLCNLSSYSFEYFQKYPENSTLLNNSSLLNEAQDLGFSKVILLDSRNFSISQLENN